MRMAIEKQGHGDWEKGVEIGKQGGDDGKQVNEYWEIRGGD